MDGSRHDELRSPRPRAGRRCCSLSDRRKPLAADQAISLHLKADTMTTLLLLALLAQVPTPAGGESKPRPVSLMSRSELNEELDALNAARPQFSPPISLM